MMYNRAHSVYLAHLVRRVCLAWCLRGVRRVHFRRSSHGVHRVHRIRRVYIVYDVCTVYFLYTVYVMYDEYTIVRLVLVL